MDIDVKKGVRPRLAPPVKNRTKYDDLYAALRVMQPGSWFEVPGSLGLKNGSKAALMKRVRNFAKKHRLVGIECGIAESGPIGAVVVFSADDVAVEKPGAAGVMPAAAAGVVTPPRAKAGRIGH